MVALLRVAAHQRLTGLDSSRTRLLMPYLARLAVLFRRQTP